MTCVGARAIFSESDNLDLNKTLGQIQEKIILPAFLPEKQRRLVFDPKMASRLKENPIVIEVEGLEHRFSTIDRTKDIRGSKALLAEALHNMHSKADWQNLEPLLAGMRKAGIKFHLRHWGKIIRLAGQNGQIYTVIECAKQADETGLLLNKLELAVSTLTLINEKIATSGNDAGQAAQALTWAKIVLDLLQRHPHDHGRLHRTRPVRGLILYTWASAIVAKQQTGEAVDHDLTHLGDDVQFLSALWSGVDLGDIETLDDFKTLDVTVGLPGVALKTRKETPVGLCGSLYVRALAYNIKAMEMVQELLGQRAEALAPVAAGLEKYADRFVRAAQTKRKGWDQEYEKITGRMPSWAELCKTA